MTQETQSVRTTNKFGRTVYKKTIDDKLTDAQLKRTTVIKKSGLSTESTTAKLSIRKALLLISVLILAASSLLIIPLSAEDTLVENIEEDGFKATLKKANHSYTLLFRELHFNKHRITYADDLIFLDLDSNGIFTDSDAELTRDAQHFSGNQIAKLLGLDSTSFNITYDGNVVTLIDKANASCKITASNQGISVNKQTCT